MRFTDAVKLCVFQIRTGALVTNLSCAADTRWQHVAGRSRWQWATVTHQTGGVHGRPCPLPARDLQELWKDRVEGRSQGGWSEDAMWVVLLWCVDGVVMLCVWCHHPTCIWLWMLGGLLCHVGGLAKLCVVLLRYVGGLIIQCGATGGQGIHWQVQHYRESNIWSILPHLWDICK